MIALAAILASGQVLPGIDRPWLNEQVRIEALVSVSPKRPLKLSRPRRVSTLVMSYDNSVIGM